MKKLQNMNYFGENKKMIVRKVYKDNLNSYCKKKLKSYSIVQNDTNI